MGGWLCGLYFSYGTCRLATLPSAPVFPSCRSWAFLLDLGSCCWWPRLSCSWPLRLYFAASASVVTVMTTRYPPRGGHDAGAGPLPLGSVALPHPTLPSPPTKHLSCLMCPIELHSVTPDAVISGTGVGTLAEAPGAVTWAWGKQAGVGRARRRGPPLPT